MNDEHSARAIQGGEAAPLSNEQKKRAVIMARRAFTLLQLKRLVGEATRFDDWRHQQCMQCVERGGLTFAAQSDWPYIMGHFAGVIAQHTDDEQERHIMQDLASRMGAKSLTQDSSFAIAKMRHECTAAADVMRDAFGFCRGISFKRFHAPPDQVSAKEIWWLIFTLRRRAAQLRRKGRSA